MQKLVRMYHCLCEHADTNLLGPSLHDVKQNPGQMQLLMCKAETFQNCLQAADDRIRLEAKLESFEEGRWASFSIAQCLRNVKGPQLQSTIQYNAI